MEKENANPTIHSVRSRRTIDCNTLGFTSINRFNPPLTTPRSTSEDESKDDSPFKRNWEDEIRTPEERSVRLALRTAASSSSSIYATNSTSHDNVDILCEAGFSLSRNETNDVKEEEIAVSFLPAEFDHTEIDHHKHDEKVEERDGFDPDEIFDIIRDIEDPEHPAITLEQLNVVNPDYIQVIDLRSMHFEEKYSSIHVGFTPTVPHCSMATLIGLCIRVKLLRSLPARFKVSIRINAGTHVSEKAINRQLNDKERVAAALENKHLLGVVNKCIAGSGGVDAM